MFTGTGDIRLFVPRAVVTRCEFVTGQIVYIFRVTDSQWENIRESLSPRRSLRVEPSDPIDLELVSASGGTVGTIADLSESGISVLLPKAAEHELLRPGAHCIRFGLPDGEDALELTARLRYRAEESEEFIRCGFEFDTQVGQDFRQYRWRIARYVWSQQDSPEGEE